MQSVFKRSGSLAAMLAATGVIFGVSSASAADLGGNCCADLEERIAELEATTARKGNRKVSLTISGWVNQQVMWWDDGSVSNVYVGDNSLEQSRVRFVGEAKIASGWSAGYVLELGIQPVTSNTWDQTQDSGTAATPIQIRKSNWFIKSKDWGQVAVGLNGTATYHLIDDADGANTRNFSDYQAAAVAQGRFILRNSAGAFFGAGSSGTLRWNDILRPSNDNASPGQSGRRNIIRYDSPDIMGFVLTASWGEDDQAGVALTYKGTWGDFKVLAKGGYETDNDTTTNPCSSNGNRTLANGQIVNLDCEWYGGGATIMHVPTGLYVYGGYGLTRDNSISVAHPGADGTDESWYIQGGIEQKWFALGKTTVFGEFRHDNTGANFSASFGGANVQNADIDFYAAGLVQNISAAEMDLYLIYRHADGSVTNAAGLTTDLDGFSTVMGGAMIRF